MAPTARRISDCRHPPAPLPALSALRSRDVEALLRERKLDRTLTTALPARARGGRGRAVRRGGARCPSARRVAARAGVRTGWSGVVRAHEPGAGPGWARRPRAANRSRSSTPSIASIRRRGVACGIDLSRLLWVRGQAITKTSGAVDPAWLPGARAVEARARCSSARSIERSRRSISCCSRACARRWSSISPTCRSPACAASRSRPGCACSGSSKAPTRVSADGAGAARAQRGRRHDRHGIRVRRGATRYDGSPRQPCGSLGRRCTIAVRRLCRPASQRPRLSSPRRTVQGTASVHALPCAQTMSQTVGDVE